MPSIVMSTSWGKVEEPQGYDTSSTSFKCLVEDSSSEDSEDDSDDEEDEVVPAQVTRKQIKYKKILTKEPLLPE
jgi:hypothetical protein